MKNLFKITLMALVICIVYSLVGNWVPQKKTYPPESKEIRDDMTQEELIEVGESIVSGKGTCLSCHKMTGEGGRFPKLGGMGAVAGSRIEGMSDVDYLGQSLYDPNTFIVEGFNPGMPPVNRPPISLTDKEILAVIAYLQSLGGEPTVDLNTKLQWQTGDGGAPAASAGAAASAPSAAPRTPEKIIEEFNCKQCHTVDTPGPMLGPTLYDVGARLSLAQIYESLLSPDATVAEGFAPVMGAALIGVDFHGKLSAAEIKGLVDYLAAKKGGQ